MSQPTKTDPTVEAVRADLHRRSQVGIRKYGTTLHENPLSHCEWLQHAYEETLDQALYLKRAIEHLEATGQDIPPLDPETDMDPEAARALAMQLARANTETGYPDVAT